jgi:leucyl aminopeptidase
MFNIKIESGGKNIVYKPLSVAVKYLIENKKLEDNFIDLETIFNLRFSQLQKKNFLSESLTQVRAVNPEGKPDELIICKIKINESFNSDYFRNHLFSLVQSFKNEELKTLHLFIPDYENFRDHFGTMEYYYQSFAEGVLYSAYDFNIYKSNTKKDKYLKVYLYASNDKKLISAINKAKILMKGVFFTRDLQNEPSNTLTPVSLAKEVREKLKSDKTTISVFNEKELEKRKMNGILAVGKGSANQPRLIIIKYSPTGEKKNKFTTVALVGKGVMFDSGGISIKPAQSMWEMKADMSGAAVVAGLMSAIIESSLNLNIIGIIPAVENMPSATSYKPGDIIKTASGKTVEVDNTDAEGRIILADALDYASKEKPDVIIDLATLTGACVVALGDFVAGLFTKNDELSSKLVASSAITNERIWPMPMWDDYNRYNKSDLADVKNLGGKWGGSISAAKFLENFVDKKIPWAHLDIAGPAMPNDSADYTRKYMTGFGVRLLFDYLNRLQDSNK